MIEKYLIGISQEIDITTPASSVHAIRALIGLLGEYCFKEWPLTGIGFSHNIGRGISSVRHCVLGLLRNMIWHLELKPLLVSMTFT